MARSKALLLGAVVLFLYLAMEWLFIVTKPSFTAMLEPFARVSMLATGYVLVAVPFLALLLLVSLASVRAVLAVLALVVGCLLFLMVDNFLYTVLELGTLGTPPAFRFLYTALFLGLVWFSYRQLRRIDLGRPALLYVALGLVVALFAVSTIGRARSGTESRFAGGIAAASTAPGPTPNVLFIGLDGVEADLVSPYGSAFDTTPFLGSTADEWLIFENAFPDTGKTTGTTIAMLTGRSPLVTRVGFPPQVLLGPHSFLHLPAILNRRGYEGYQYTVRYYADAFDLNQRDGFSEANGRTRRLRRYEDTAWVRWFNDELFFLQTLSERLSKRLRYVFFLEDMLTHHLVVKERAGLGFEYDLAGVTGFERFVSERRGPFYGHLHFLATHCCEHHPRSQHFRPADFPGVSPQAAARAAARLSSIRDADGLIERIYRFLAASDLLERTILVIYSDHSYDWDSVQRVPLLVRFPGAAHAGRRSENVLLSMVPALLAEPLGIDTPEWMRSGPGLEDPPSASPRAPGPPLFGLSAFEYRRFTLDGGGLSRITDAGPPNYGIRSLSMILCSRWFKANLPEKTIVTGTVPGHTAPCPEASYPDGPQVVAAIEAKMAEHGLVWGR